VPAGSVISTTPAAGAKLRRGDPVALVVSRGPQLITIPSVVGQTLQDATAAIEALKLQVTTTTQADPQGIVISEDPPANQMARAGDTVTLVVSAQALVTVPNVVGMRFNDAQQTLRDAGFQVQRQNGFLSFGNRVQRQDPAGGSQAVQGSTVTLFT